MRHRARWTDRGDGLRPLAQELTSVHEQISSSRSVRIEFVKLGPYNERRTRRTSDSMIEVGICESAMRAIR
jgi:hypothetical protein